ncbi:MAG: PolC-type DNA polymerase III [Myxococcota bacterium]
MPATVQIGGTVSGLEALREWLRVPRSLSLPAWAAARLGVNVARELDARRGRTLQRATFGVIDLETTGLSPRSARILEIGLVVLRGDAVLARFGTLVDVGGPVPSGITALTGIDDSLLAGAPREADALESLAGLLAEHSVDVLVAHNARFDRGFLAGAWRAHERPDPLPPFLCSVRAARRFVRAPRFGLDALIAHLAIPERARHRALGDAEMTADLWIELLARARLAGVHTLEALSELAAVGEPKPRRRRVHVVEVRA